MQDTETFQDVLNKLRQNIDRKFIKERPAYRDRNGRDVMKPYIAWHTVAEILDNIAVDWSDSIKEIKSVGDAVYVISSLTIRGVTREGIGTSTQSDTSLAIKSATSDALKRAAVKFGVGRKQIYMDDDSDYSPADNVYKAPARTQAAPQPPVQPKQTTIQRVKPVSNEPVFGNDNGDKAERNMLNNQKKAIENLAKNQGTDLETVVNATGKEIWQVTIEDCSAIIREMSKYEPATT